MSISCLSSGISSRKRFLLASVLGFLSAVAPLCTDLFLPAFPQMQQNLMTHAAQIQLSLTTCLAGIALGQAFIGPLSDMYGRRGVLLISLLIFVISSLGCAWASTVEILIATRFIQGLSGAGAVVLSRAIASDLYSGPELTRFFALLMLINGLAPVLSPVVGGQLLKVMSWRGTFVVLGGLGLIGALAAFRFIEETLPREKRHASGLSSAVSIFRKLLRNGGFMRYTLGHSFIFMILFSYIASSPFILQEMYGLTPAQFSYCFACISLGLTGSTQLAGRLSGRFGDQRLLNAGLVVCLLSSLTVLGVTICRTASVIILLIPLFIAVSCVGIVTITTFSLAIRQQSGMAGSAAGLIGVLSFMAGGIAAPLVGLCGSQTAIPLGVMLVLASLASILACGFRKQD